MIKTALITDDVLFMRHTLNKTLQQLDFYVVGEASNGIEAVEKYKKLKPHLVIMDITMPEMDGLEALKKIMQIDPRAVIVMCSAIGQRDMIIKAIQEGAFDFIVKPFNFNRVQETINRVNIEIEERRKLS